MTPPPNLPAARCDCGAEQHEWYGEMILLGRNPHAENCATRPPQPEKGKGGEVEIIGGATAEMRAEFDAVLAKLRDMPDDEFAQKMQEANAPTATHALTDEEIRVRIAEWCGWRAITSDLVGIPPGSRGNADAREIPAYTTSLDAIASAEARLTDTQHNAYRLQIIHTLAEDQGVPWSDIYGNGRVWFSAPPRIRSRALLLTINSKNSHEQ